MSSMSIACGVTHQSIAVGTPVRMVPIWQQRDAYPLEGSYRGIPLSGVGYARGFSSPNSFWEPLSPFLQGVMAEAGHIDLRDSPENRATLDFLFGWLAEFAVTDESRQGRSIPFDIKVLRDQIFPEFDQHLLDQGSAAWFAIPFSRYVALWQGVAGQLATRQLFCVSKPYLPVFTPQDIRPVSLYVLSEVAYQQVIIAAKSGFELTWHPTELADWAVYLHNLKAAGPSRNLTEASAAVALLKENYLTHLEQCDSGKELAYLFQPHALKCLTKGTFAARNYFKMPAQHAVNPELLELLWTVAEAHLFEMGMLRMNLVIAPALYAGSVENNQAGLLYAKLVNATCEALAVTKT